MAIERTLSIIKPDAVAKNAIGQIEARFEAAGLTIVALKMMQLSEEKAGGSLTVPKTGVVAEFLTPTDYSPWK